ncbi:hypothetical protein B7463_g9970, partial [Scytalidium lignicola]
MATAPPKINTYHCLCSSLLLTSTHTLSSLPRRSGLDKAIILPLSTKPPILNAVPRSPSPSPSNPEENEVPSDKKPTFDIPQDLPPAGFSMLIHMRADKKPIVIRREDGFEKRLLWRCGRCRLVVGYQIPAEGGEPMDVDSSGKGRSGEDEEEEEERDLKVVYLLPGGLMSTDAIAKKDIRIPDAEVEVLDGIPAWE